MMFVVFLCVFESVAFAVHIDDDGVMHESVDHRAGGLGFCDSPSRVD